VETECDGREGEDWAACPECGARLKCKNIAGHLKKQHGIEPELDSKGGARGASAWVSAVLAVVVVAIMIFAYFHFQAGDGSGGQGGLVNDQQVQPQDPSEPGKHTVILEIFGTTWCTYCVQSEEAAQSLFDSGQLDFVFVNFILDVGNSEANSRASDFGVASYPTQAYDGGLLVRAGAQNSAQMREDITVSRNQGGPDVKVEARITGNSGGDIAVRYDIENDGGGDFNGRARVYIVEIQSQYLNNDGRPIPYGFVGFAANEPVTVAPDQQLTGYASLSVPNAQSSNLAAIVAVFDDGGSNVDAQIAR